MFYSFALKLLPAKIVSHWKIIWHFLMELNMSLPLTSNLGYSNSHKTYAWKLIIPIFETANPFNWCMGNQTAIHAIEYHSVIQKN